jgi:hypothetical protein
MSKKIDLRSGQKCKGSHGNHPSAVMRVYRQSNLEMEGERNMLSVILNDIFAGVDIAKRYPSFYEMLLRDATLQQNFVDVLEIMEKDKKGELVELPAKTKIDLSFLLTTPQRPLIFDLGNNSWKVQWHRTIKQLQSVFFPPELSVAYRSGSSIVEEAWFTLFRGDVGLHGKNYSLQLECEVSEDVEDALAAYLHLAVTFETEKRSLFDPLYATLLWGSYKETLIITDQGRARFPDIPLVAALDEQKENVVADLNLTIGTSP